MHLEPLEGSLGLGAEETIQRTGFVVQAAQQALHLENTPRGSRTFAVVDTERCPGLGAGDAVCRKTMRQLDTPNRTFGQRAVEAIYRTRSVRLVAEGALEVAHAC